MTSNTILAVPTRLIAREGVTPAKSIRINNYTQAGANGKLVSSTTVGLQRNMVDLDEAMDFTINTDGGKLNPVANKKRERDNQPQPADNDFGYAVSRPSASKRQATPTDLVELAKRLLGAK
jgi:hypothetical protein